ncbi:MAG: Tryptophan-tRNA ligase [Candidatus Falkowbacteria bacterium GW2011_GWA2_41_14]|uniref:Tryptophan--tRNA ligase n=1 Tax=Candidatus Falkowbacteria bacterium GW2011_GWA2_41_14 TaxID=1618635 RepID=A0A0G0X5A6_9BACT|nr:MAG: Tryptophan-tRNA ligase [Candidatus Falkowbacteria bacterium GW2011_GWA2_41_14]
MELDMKNNKATVFSGVQPSGVLHIGNYLGALAQWVEMQNQYNCIFCVVDYHAITVKQESQELSRRILDVVKIYLASGINPEQAVIFQQSDITAHTELAWILNCAAARLADLNKMTQFKDKGAKKEPACPAGRSVSVGLYDYPVLMAADILLYNTDLVPVGDDQVQHVELCRTLAERFNRDYGQVFKAPQVAVRKQGARIMGLDDPTKKMSKSASSPANYIALTDAPEIAAKKIKRAVTDSGSEVKFDQKQKPALANLLTIYSLLAGIKIKELEENYKGKGYGEFKNGLAEEIKKFLREFQIKYNSFTDQEVKQILRDGADKIRPVANKTLKRVKNKLGII